MRALILFTILLLNQIAFGQDQATPTATPEATTEEALPTADEPASTPTPPVKSGWVVNPNLTAFSRKLEQSGVTSDIQFVQLDSKVGYVMSYGLFVGLQGSYEIGKAKDTAGGSVDTNTYLLGPSVGYSDKYTGFFVTATYHLLGKADYDTAEYGRVTGLQIDLGYPMDISENLKFGPQLSWKSLKFSDSSDVTALDDDITNKEVTPYFALWYYF